MKIEHTSLASLQSEVVKWANQTFPGQTRESVTKHLVKEAKELASKPWDISEMADVLILLVRAANLNQISADSLLSATFNKHEINKLRKWGPPNADGVQEHLRE